MEEKRGSSGAGSGRGGRITAVAEGSPAAAAGIIPGDVLLSIDGHGLRDVIDYQFHVEPGVRLLLERGGRQLELRLPSDPGDPGISFQSAVFDRVRTCACNCVFCFVDQLPPGLRPPLYVRDDDFRLSFLGGNFITLNNLSGRDLERVVCQRLGPLYVSVHATDTAIRAELMGVRESVASRGLNNLRHLGEQGIELHVQVVLCPGVNDGAVLTQTITELADDFPGVISVGVVPVSLSAEYAATHSGPGLRPVNAEESLTVLATINELQAGFRRDRGSRFAYAADEFYLLAAEPLPVPQAYDNYPQYENGIGIAASFLENLEDLQHRLQAMPPEGGVYLLTGTLGAPVVQAACEKLSRKSQAAVSTLVAGNRLFGPHVTVTGLLGGRDIVRAAEAMGLGRKDLLLLPEFCLSGREEPRFLDGLTLAELNETLPSTATPSPPL